MKSELQKKIINLLSELSEALETEETSIDSEPLELLRQEGADVDNCMNSREPQRTVYTAKYEYADVKRSEKKGKCGYLVSVQAKTGIPIKGKYTQEEADIDSIVSGLKPFADGVSATIKRMIKYESADRLLNFIDEERHEIHDASLINQTKENTNEKV